MWRCSITLVVFSSRILIMPVVCLVENEYQMVINILLVSKYYVLWLNCYGMKYSNIF